jgi:hypothetical protein
VNSNSFFSRYGEFLSKIPKKPFVGFANLLFCHQVAEIRQKKMIIAAFK